MEEENKNMPLTASMDLKPIQISSSGWKPRSIGQTGSAGPAPDGHMPPDVVQRKVKGLLNKMTPEKFERIADQILEIAAQSKNESDGRTLRQVIQLTFEKATDEAHWASTYALFCERMLKFMSSDIKDENIKDKHGNVVTGGALFRKYLLNRCQEEFERGWKVNMPPKPEGQTEEAALLSEEYYIAAAAKRRGLGLVKFIGELYKLTMLTERIMHECIKKLLELDENGPDESEVESLVSLLNTVGLNLEQSERGPAMMNVYFERIVSIMNHPDLPSRLRFKLLDVIDLRKQGWQSKNDDKGPKTLAEIHADAQRKQHEAELERLRQQASNRGGGGRLPMGRGDARNFSGGRGMPPPDYSSNNVGTDDLRRLNTRTIRNSSNSSGPSLGPSSLFSNGRTNSARRGLGPSPLLNRGDDSGTSSRTGTPPQREKDKKEDGDKSNTNAFR
jgi:translation initiation factor 4G